MTFLVKVGPDDRIYVTDTGNNRVQIFNQDGNYVGEFGGSGEEQGFLNEPVGITISEAGEIFIADSWNQRIQVFGLNGMFIRAWEIPSWQTVLPESKPYLAVNHDYLYVVDPLAQRILVFSSLGEYMWSLRDSENVILPGGVSIAQDQLHVVDASRGQIVIYDIKGMTP